MIRLIPACLNVAFKINSLTAVTPELIVSDYITTGRQLGRTKAVLSCVTPQEGAWSGGSEAWLPNPSSLTYFNRNGRVKGLGETSWYEWRHLSDMESREFECFQDAWSGKQHVKY